MQTSAITTTTSQSYRAAQITENDQSYRFPVALEPAYDRHGHEVPRTKLVVRQDTSDVLATVSDRYKLITHDEIMKPVHDFARILGKSSAQFSLEKNGAKLVATHTFRDIAITLPGHKMPGQKAVGDVVALRTYATNSYNTTTPFEFQLGAMVLKCLNGATALNDLFRLRFKHVGDLRGGIHFPKPEIVLEAFKKQGDIWSVWADQEVKQPQKTILVEEGVKLQLMSKRSYTENQDYFDRADTVWDIYNAFTYVITHSNKILESGKISRFDRLNGLFNHVFAEQTAV